MTAYLTNLSPGETFALVIVVISFGGMAIFAVFAMLDAAQDKVAKLRQKP